MPFCYALSDSSDRCLEERDRRQGHVMHRERGLKTERDLASVLAHTRVEHHIFSSASCYPSFYFASVLCNIEIYGLILSVFLYVCLFA